MGEPQKTAVRRAQAASRKWRTWMRYVAGPDTPHWVAVGCLFGWAMGMIPEESLLVYLLGVIAILCPANLLACLGSFIVGSLLSSLLVIPLDKVGTAILTIDALQPVYRVLMDWPLVSWTRFNQSVVCGGIAISVISALPLYVTCRLAYGPIYARLSAQFVDSALSDAEYSSPGSLAR